MLAALLAHFSVWQMFFMKDDGCAVFTGHHAHLDGGASRPISGLVSHAQMGVGFEDTYLTFAAVISE